MHTPKSKPRTATYAGVFLLSAATLLFQVTLTRVFSVSIWYHFAFLVVSVALFGFGASGVALALFPARFQRAETTARAAAAFGVSAIASYVATNAIPFSPFRLASEPAQLVYFAAVDLLLAVPFFFAGSAIANVLRTWPREAGKLYAVDLAGASLGTLLLFAALPPLGGARTVALATVIGLGAALALAESKRLRRTLAVACAAGLVLLVSPRLLPDVRIDATKPLRVEVDERGGTVAHTRWNSLSRIDVVERDGADPMILIDAAAMTPIAAPVTADSWTLRDVSSAVYRLQNNPRTLIIGSGGGIDVQNALALGARDVTCVEINPIIVDLVTRVYRERVGGVFADPRVRLVRDEGRSFIERSSASFDVLQLTLIDTWAAGASGAYSLTENYLYTSDAVEAYLRSLTENGMLSITRWYFEAPRLASLTRVALERLGVREPGAHVLVVRKKISTTFLAKRNPFTSEEVARARAFAAEIGAEIVYDPFAPEGETFFNAYLTSSRPHEILDASHELLDPVSDDSPFFFQMARWRDVKPSDLRVVTAKNFLEPLVVPVGQLVLLAALLIALALSAALLGLVLARGAISREGRVAWLGYFFALGFAYIVVEVVLMQRFALLLGHPTYAVTLVLSAILAFSGLGSAWSARRTGALGAALRPALIGLPLSLLALSFAVPWLTEAAMPAPLAARLTTAALCIAPVAFFMGVPFPTGLRAAHAEHPSFVGWAWAANGCASVIGSVCAVLGAMVWGFTAMLLVAGLVYVAALAGVSRRPVLVE